MTPQDKRGQAEGIRRQASDIVSLGAPIGLGVFADLLSAPGAIGFSAIAMAGTCAFCVFRSDAFSLHACALSQQLTHVYVPCSLDTDGFFHRTAVGVPEEAQGDADSTENKKDSES